LVSWSRIDQFGEGAQLLNLDLNNQHLRELSMIEASEARETLHPLITLDRDTGNGFAISCRHYASADEVEVVAIRLDKEDSLKRGGGARRKNTEKMAMDELTLRKSEARARTSLKRKVLSMSADRMLTLTFKDNVEDITVAWDRFKYFCKLMRFRYRDRFQYVAVPEYQKRGAVHFHLALSDYYHIQTVRRFWLKAVGRFGGNVDITSPRKFGKKSWNPKRIANYISKYLSKTDSVDFNKRRYSTGGKIQVPDPERGWLALGVPVVQVMRQVVEALTRKQVACVWESEGFFGITYVST